MFDDPGLVLTDGMQGGDDGGDDERSPGGGKHDTLAHFRSAKGIVLSIAPEEVQAINSVMGKTTLILRGGACIECDIPHDQVAEVIDAWRLVLGPPRTPKTREDG